MLEEAVDKMSGFKFSFDANDRFVGQVMMNNNYELYESELFVSKVSKGDVVFDVGANIGYYVFLAAKKMGLNHLFGRGKIFAFEPNMKNFLLLDRNIKMNSLKNISLHNEAVGQINTTGHLYLSKDNFGDHRMSTTEGWDCEDVSIVSLDSVIKKSALEPDVLKIDTQGYDLYVLKGIEGFLKKKKKLKLFTEFWDFGNKQAGVNSKEYFDFLHEYFKEVLIIDEEKRLLRRVSFSEVMDLCSLHENKGHVNFYCET